MEELSQLTGASIGPCIAQHSHVGADERAVACAVRSM